MMQGRGPGNSAARDGDEGDRAGGAAQQREIEMKGTAERGGGAPQEQEIDIKGGGVQLSNETQR